MWCRDFSSCRAWTVGGEPTIFAAWALSCGPKLCRILVPNQGSNPSSAGRVIPYSLDLREIPRFGTKERLFWKTRHDRMIPTGDTNLDISLHLAILHISAGLDWSLWKILTPEKIPQSAPQTSPAFGRKSSMDVALLPSLPRWRALNLHSPESSSFENQYITINSLLLWVK